MGRKLLPFLFILGVQAAGEQAAEGIGEIIEADAAVIVALAHPHVRMENMFVQAVAVGLLLSLQHHTTQAVRRKEIVFTAGKARRIQTGTGSKCRR